MKIQHEQILAAAKARGLRVIAVSTVLQQEAAILKSDQQSELFIQGTPVSLINLQALRYFDNKQLTKYALKELGIPFPRSIIFQHPDSKEIETFFKKGQTYVCKPADMAEGTGVEMNLKSLHEIHDYWLRNKHLSDSFLLEEQIEGMDLRVQVLAGKIVAACTREPAFVIGDGQKCLEDLIEARRIIVKHQNPGNDILIDQATSALLKQQNLSLRAIPEKGLKVRLKELANMSHGAVATDITDELHPLYHHWIDQIVEYFKTPYFAIDFIAPDPAAEPSESAVALEINAQPEWLHHTFSEGKKHDIASMILHSLFG